MKCKACKSKAVIELPEHHTAYCGPCFEAHCRRQVMRAVEKHRMIEPAERVLVAVSGGKDSLALWHLLASLGYDCDGLHIQLGIGAYSDRSREICESFAASRGFKLHVVELREEFGFGIPDGSARSNRPTCSLCGMTKRHVLNGFAVEHGYDVLATGHNLDDEAATLLSNLLRWDIDLLLRQSPVLERRPGFVKKVKPLVRLSERETAAYCVISGIDYVVEECPLVAGNTQLRYKEVLSALERHSPGTKRSFLFGYFSKGRRLFEQGQYASSFGTEGEGGQGVPVAQTMGQTSLVACGQCGSPTPANEGSDKPLCAFCREVYKIQLRASRTRTYSSSKRQTRA